MSLEAELIRVAARLFIRPGNRPEASVAVQHERMRSYERWVPRPPEGTETIYRPLGTIPAYRVARAGARPGRIILFLHGGGYVTGSPTLYQHVTWRFAAAARAQVIAIDYRLAPAHPFPAAINDAAVAWRALLAEGALAQRCAILGDSAGGGLALSVLGDATATTPAIAAVAVFSPWLDLALTGASFASPDIHDPIFQPEMLAGPASAYLAGADPKDGRASPLYAVPDVLPPLLIQVGGDEILLDDARRYAQAAADKGGEVRLDIFEGLHHVFQGATRDLPSARSALDTVAAFLNRHWA